MNGFVSSYEQNELIKDYQRTFDTFARPVIIWKQPIETSLITGPSNPGLFGMSDGQVASQITYTPVSGVYNAIIRYVLTKRNVQGIEVIDETNTFAPLGEVTLKFQNDAYLFIENSGQTDQFEFDNRSWYFASKAKSMYFLGNLYWQYQVKPKT